MSVDDRHATVERETAETRVHIELNVDGAGTSDVATGVGFFDHMLATFARHGRFDLTVRCEGDLHIDEHHTVEDVALTLGAALDQALGERTGIVRMGDAAVPLDEALVQVAVDVGGRPYAAVSLDFAGERIGELPVQMVAHALQSFATAARMSLHVRQLAGANDHHIAEAAMKALGRALDVATRLDERIAGSVASTKETLTA